MSELDDELNSKTLEELQTSLRWANEGMDVANKFGSMVEYRRHAMYAKKLKKRITELKGTP